MALQLETQNPYGEIASEAYWKIVESNINWQNYSCHISLCCWVNQQARLDGKQPFTSKNFDWSGSEFPYTIDAMNEAGNNLVIITYNKIKSSSTTNELGEEVPSEFSNALDV